MFCTRKKFMRVSRNLTVRKINAAPAKEAARTNVLKFAFALAGLCIPERPDETMSTGWERKLVEKTGKEKQ
jgi:hypothetical protein